jgi:2-dehydro-3-deoxygluconokinase
VLFESADPARLSDWAITAGARSVAVKLGAAGAWVANPETALAIAAHPVHAIDATGAGDCFGGVMVARLIAGDTLAAAARAAAVAAAIATTGRGAIDPLPRWADIAPHLPPAPGSGLAPGADG